MKIGFVNHATQCRWGQIEEIHRQYTCHEEIDLMRNIIHGDPDNYANRFTPPVATIDQIVTAVAPLPEKAFLPADRARVKAMKYMTRPSILQEIDKYRQEPGEPLVCRLMMTTNTSFRGSKAGYLASDDGVPDQIDLLVVNFRLPHFLWIMQIAPLSTYKNGQGVAEIVLDSTAGHEEIGLIYMRVGRHFITSAYEKNPVIPSCERFPLYRHNLGDSVV